MMPLIDLIFGIEASPNANKPRIEWMHALLDNFPGSPVAKIPILDFVNKIPLGPVPGEAHERYRKE